MDITKEDIGARLKDLRSRASLTQAIAAERFGANLSTYKTWEQGVAFVPIPTLAKMADFYGVVLDWLIAGREQEGTDINADEERLIRLYRGSGDKGKYAILVVATDSYLDIKDG